VPVERGDTVVAHWGGRRSDLPEEYPKFVTALKSQAHFLSVEQALFEQLGLRGRGPLALSMVTTAEDDERLDHVNVSTGKLTEVVFEGSVPLTAKPTVRPGPGERHYDGSWPNPGPRSGCVAQMHSWLIPFCASSAGRASC
jgi:hypothetical protein